MKKYALSYSQLTPEQRRLVSERHPYAPKPVRCKTRKSKGVKKLSSAKKKQVRNSISLLKKLLK